MMLRSLPAGTVLTPGSSSPAVGKARLQKGKAISCSAHPAHPPLSAGVCTRPGFLARSQRGQRASCSLPDPSPLPAPTCTAGEVAPVPPNPTPALPGSQPLFFPKHAFLDVQPSCMSATHTRLSQLRELPKHPKELSPEAELGPATPLPTPAILCNISEFIQPWAAMGGCPPKNTRLPHRAGTLERPSATSAASSSLGLLQPAWGSSSSSHAAGRLPAPTGHLPSTARFPPHVTGAAGTRRPSDLRGRGMRRPGNLTHRLSSFPPPPTTISI